MSSGETAVSVGLLLILGEVGLGNSDSILSWGREEQQIKLGHLPGSRMTPNRWVDGLASHRLWLHQECVLGLSPSTRYFRYPWGFVSIKLS